MHHHTQSSPSHQQQHRLFPVDATTDTAAAMFPWPESTAALPSIPPPPIYGIRGDGNVEDSYFAHYYHMITPNISSSTAPAASRRADYSPSHTRWPTPQDIPLPHAFPLPPRHLTEGSSSLLLDQSRQSYPPPIPEWWAAAATAQLPLPPMPPQLPEFGDNASNRSDHSGFAHSTVECPYCQQGRAQEHHQQQYMQRGEEDSGSDCSSCPACAAEHYHREEEEEARLHTRKAMRNQQPPIPLSSSSVSKARASATAGKRFTSHDALGANQGEEGGRGGARVSFHSAVSAPTPISTTTKRKQQQQLLLEARQADVKASEFLQGIEDLYARLRANYEELCASKANTMNPSAKPEKSMSAKAARKVRSQGSVQEKGTGSARAISASVSGTTKSFFQPPQQTSLEKQQQQDLHKHKQETPRVSSPPSRAAPASTALALSGQSLSLRNELLVLESQWRRLEELKQGHIATADPSTLASMSKTDVKSANTSRHKAAESFSSQDVMQLIHERKAAVVK